MLELTTSLMFLASALYGAVPATNSEIINLPVAKQVTDKPITLEDHVREYFEDTPLMAEVARCESQFRQYGKNGKPIRGEVNKYDVGIMQINELYHSDQAKKLNYDLHTLEGNMAYAKYLYEKEGLKPWRSSSICWDKDNSIAIAPIEGRKR